MAAIAEPGSFGGVLLRVLTGFAILAGQNNLMLAELLSKKFSAKQAGPKRTIQALYSVLVEQEASPEIQLAYDRWIALYSTSAYQTDETSRKQDRLWGEHFRLPGERELNDPARLVFSIHTFFAVVAKLLGCLAANCCGSAQILDLKNWTKIPNDRLGQNFQQLENGSFFEQAGLPHFLRGDVFGWYASNPTPELLSCLREIIGVLAECEDLLVTEAGGREDLLKKFYLALIPPAVRKSLGEYYTPEWLAQRVLDMLEDGKFRAKPDTRLLDPACGSGTFLVLAIDAARRSGGCADMPPGRLLQAICRNIAGIDRNPLAVIAARVNYLIALGPLLKDRGREALEIPVYLGDSIRNDSLRDCEPSLKEQFDYVVGNPPWIGWENLPEDYRRATKKLWQEHGLFVHGGMDTILGKGKKDLSMLMTYVAADHYLKEGGKLGFVINQAVFKMAGAGQGFRRFLTRSKASLCCERVEDYSALQLFEGASAKAAVFVLKKGEKQRYPVPYFVARDTSGPGKSPTGSNRVILTGELCEAEPSDPSDPTSCWLTGNLSQLKALKKVMGRSDYEAHLGVNTGGANAVYWFEILKEEAFGCVVARNLVGAAKRKVKSQVVRLEKARLFPLLRGKDVSLWRAIPGAWLLLTQDPRTRRGIDESEMKKTPKTLEWLQQHQRMLQERAAYKRFFKTAEAPFWSMFDVGHYTLKPWKVVWPRIASQLEAAVVASMEGKPVLAQETFSCIGLECETEAFYVAGTINSTPFRLAVKAFSQPGSKSFGTPGILERARIPRFDPSSVLHYRISAEARKLCKGWQGPVGVAPLDALCRQLWGLTEQELKGLQTPPV